MEKVPGHGLCPDLRGPGRPARSMHIQDRMPDRGRTSISRHFALENRSLVDFTARLLNMIISDSQLGFSLASFVRQATSLRESWLGDVCVRGRRCTPAKFWHRNLFEHPPCAAELPPDFQQSFTDGKPWFFGQQAFGP